MFLELGKEQEERTGVSITVCYSQQKIQLNCTLKSWLTSSSSFFNSRSSFLIDFLFISDSNKRSSIFLFLYCMSKSVSCICRCRCWARKCLITCEFCENMTFSTGGTLHPRNVLPLILTMWPGWLSPHTASGYCYINYILYHHPMMTSHYYILKRTSTSLTWYLLITSGVQGIDLVIIEILLCCGSSSYIKINIEGSKLILLGNMPGLLEPAPASVAAADCKGNQN